MATTTDVKNQVARRQQGNGNGKPPAPATTHGHTLLDTLEQMKPQIARALPSMVKPERFIRVALTTLRQNPKLMQCTPESVLGGLMTSAQLGLEPGPLGHAYLVPFWNKRLRSFEAVWILGYVGIIDLARRSGQVESIQAHEVYTGDHFEYSYGLDEHLEHRPAEDDRGEFRGAYAFAKYIGGGHNFVYLPESEIERHRERSRAKDDGPWVTDYDAMARKTAIRALRPYLPLSVEMADAFAADETARLFSGEGDDGVIDIAPEPEPEIEAGQDPQQGNGNDDASTEGDAGGQTGDGPGSQDAGRDASEPAPDTKAAADDDGDGPPESAAAAPTASGSESHNEGPETGNEQTGSLSRTQYAELREAGFDDDTRSQLVYAATDGRTRRSKKLTADERRRIMKAAAASKAGAVSVVADGPDGQPVLVDRDGAIFAAPDLDELTWEEQLAGGDGS